MSIREFNEPTRICGASEGHEIPGGLIGGKNARAVTLGAAVDASNEFGDEIELGPRGELLPHPTTRKLAIMSSACAYFIP
jgi:hypothetical protein